MGTDKYTTENRNHTKHFFVDGCIGRLAVIDRFGTREIVWCHQIFDTTFGFRDNKILNFEKKKEKKSVFWNISNTCSSQTIRATALKLKFARNNKRIGLAPEKSFGAIRFLIRPLVSEIAKFYT